MIRECLHNDNRIQSVNRDATWTQQQQQQQVSAAMTELIVPRGDTFPRSFLDSYRASRTSDQLCYDLKSSRSDELVLQTHVDIPPVGKEMQHGHSENLLDERGAVNGEVDSVDRCEIVLPRSRRKRVSVYDRVDPEDSIRDIVTENDFYRWVKVITRISWELKFTIHYRREFLL